MISAMPKRLAVVIGVLLLQPTLAAAEVRTAADALPETVAAYVEIADGPEVLAAVVDHPVRQQVEQLPGIVKAKQQPQYLQFQLVLKFVELKLGHAWRPAIEKLTRHGVHVAWDGATKGVVLLAHADDAAFLAGARDVFLELATNDARDHNRAAPESVDYRGVAAIKFGEAGLAVVGEWLVVANNHDLGKQVLDRLLGDSKPSLAQNESFAGARPEGDHSAWAWIDLAALRNGGAVKDLFRGHAEDLGGELILGGVLAALSKSPYVALALDVNADGLKLSGTLPGGDTEAIDGPEYFFGAGLAGSAPPPVSAHQQLASLRAYRDIAALWRESPELFNEQVNAKLAKAESDLSTLFGGKSFSDEILPSLGPQVQLVFARQDFASAGGPTPAAKLPAAAAIFRLTSPEAQRPLRIAFQSLIGFVNLSAPQEGRSPLAIMTETVDGATLVSTAYDMMDASDPKGAGIHFNFTPTVAFVDEWFVLSSTRALAVDVAAQLGNTDNRPGAAGQVSGHAVVNTAVELSAPVLKQLLSENHEHLIAQNMLEKGHDREAAEQEIGALEAIVGWLDAASLRLAVDEKELQLALSVDLAD
jgi:hypothetical protein